MTNTTSINRKTIGNTDIASFIKTIEKYPKNDINQLIYEAIINYTIGEIDENQLIDEILLLSIREK